MALGDKVLFFTLLLVSAVFGVAAGADGFGAGPLAYLVGLLAGAAFIATSRLSFDYDRRAAREAEAALPGPEAGHALAAAGGQDRHARPHPQTPDDRRLRQRRQTPGGRLAALLRQYQAKFNFRAPPTHSESASDPAGSRRRREERGALERLGSRLRRTIRNIASPSPPRRDSQARGGGREGKLFEKLQGALPFLQKRHSYSDGETRGRHRRSRSETEDYEPPET